MELNEQVLKRIKGLVAKGETVLETARRVSNMVSLQDRVVVDTLLCAEWRSQSIVFLEEVFGPTHRYTQYFRESFGEASKHSASIGQGVLRAVLDDVEQGNISVRGLITAEVLSDFLEQAEHLLEKGYTTPATSLAGAVLESELRSISLREGIQVKESDNLPSLMQKLVDKGVYFPREQKKVTVWTDTRNRADHGKFDEVSKSDADYLIGGVRSLLDDVREK